MNLKELMQQAQVMQQKMKEMQSDIASKSYEGKAGGGLVSILMSGTGEMQNIKLDPSLIDIDEKEMLEDLIVAAYNDAKTKADTDSKNNMSGAFAEFGGLPPGFKF